MRVRVDKPRQNDATTSVYDFTVTIDQPLNLIRAPNPFNPWPVNEQRTGRDDAQLAHLWSNTRPRRPGKRYNLRTIDYR
jgi:hypothetical protein